MPAPANLVHETSTTTGTGNLTVTAVNGKIRFSDSTYAFGTGGTNVFWYFASNQAAAEWEIGTGHMSDANTLVRDTIIFSSNSNNAVSFSAGTKDVTNDVPAGEQFYTGKAFLRGYLHGLGLSNAADADHDITVAVGECASDDYDELLTLASAVTKRIDATWAVGTGNGGLDTGTVANATWYHVWLIKRTDTGVVDALFSTSATSPTMPANYDEKRRIGSVRTNSSANIIAFTQRHDEFRWAVAVEDVDAANPGTSAVTRTLTVPTGIIVEAIMNVGVYNGSENDTAYFSPLSVSDQAVHNEVTADLATPGGTVTSVASVAAWFFTPFRCLTNTSGQIRSRLQQGGASNRIGIITLGWIDDRGKLS